MNNTYCVIMAGGIGSRFWPLSRSSRPKQFLDILGTGKSLIRHTFERLTKICPAENILVVTSSLYTDLVISQIPELKKDQILAEPLRRNTAPCIAYACQKIKKRNPNANIIVAPSDHLITREEEFIKQLQNGLKFVKEHKALLTLGIQPNRPETGYGYIQINSKIQFGGLKNLFKVKTFTEKPDLKMATVFIESGEFFWNSGIFIWSLEAILAAFEEYLPEVGSLFASGHNFYDTDSEVNFLNKVYSECPNISIDYGIMEKAPNVYVLTADFGWSDLGTWGSLYDNCSKDKGGNVILSENVEIYNSKNCIVHTPQGKLVVVEGLKDYIVVESENTLLICKKQDEQQIRQIVNDIRINHGEEYI
ncbi:MAG: mannose-1-phosphate guanylyltransferase [Bacteroidota bacterium]|nr:mannose-1-phosphate guanylyltransferase [Bacteroidota bacterium]